MSLQQLVLANWQRLLALERVYQVLLLLIFVTGVVVSSVSWLENLLTGILLREIGTWRVEEFSILFGLLLAMSFSLVGFGFVLGKGRKHSTSSSSSQEIQIDVATSSPPYFFEHGGVAWKGYEDSRNAHGPYCPKDHYELVRTLEYNTWKCPDGHGCEIEDLGRAHLFAKSIASKKFDEMLVRKDEELGKRQEERRKKIEWQKRFPRWRA